MLPSSVGSAILTRPGGVLEHYRRRYEATGVLWQVSNAGLTHLVNEAMHHKTGARALEHVAHKMLGGELLFEAATADMQMAVRLEPNWPKAKVVPA